MELAFLTLLLKDGANCVSRSVTINDEGIFKSWLAKDRGCANRVNKSLESGLVLIFPMEMTTFRAVGDKSIERRREHTEIANVHSIEIEEA